MKESLREISDHIINEAIRAVLPDAAVKRALDGKTYPGKVIMVAVGKAAWQMAKAAEQCLGDRIDRGVVVTKYDHVKEEIPHCTCIEAGHPVPDENSFLGTQAAIDAVTGLSAQDTVLFLVSGGGSALFEKPLISGEELADITNRLLACGADIVEMNTVRKRLSAVKGGKFAKLCEPAKVHAIVLSDILGDPLDMIASGPACPDTSTGEDAKRIIEKYNIELSEQARALMEIETPKEIFNVTTEINGSVKELCLAAARACEGYGYEPVILTDQLCCQAKEAGSFLASIARTHIDDGRKIAFIAGGETVVHLTGRGKGGRNQEIALAASVGIADLGPVAVFSVGSDGTDGPTDAAGGYVDAGTHAAFQALGIDEYEVLKENDAYNALEKVEGLIKTGPTGTNVNDVAIVLIG